MSKTPDMRVWEIDHETTLEEVFAELATTSLVQIAAKRGIPYSTARSWVRRMGVQVERQVTFAGVSK